MFSKLLKFELNLQSKQVGFWIAAAVMFILGALTPWLIDIFPSGAGGEKFKVNGAQMVAGQIASWDIAAIFFGAIFVVTGILRDKTFSSLEIIHATPVSTPNMTGTRMIGIYLTVLICIFANTLGGFLGQFNPQIDAEVLGPVRPLYYLQPMVLFTLINALFVTAFYTLVAGLTQNRMLVFVSAIGLFFYSIMSGMIMEFDPPKWIQALVDPFANIAYSLDTEFWSAEDRNTRMLPIFSYVGLNRLVWGAISILTLLAVFGRFKRGLITGKTKLVKTDVSKGPIKPYEAFPPKSGLAADFKAWLAQTKFEYIATVRSIPFYILGGLAAMLFAFITIVTVFFSPQKLVPTSSFMSALGFTSFLIPVVLIIAFFSGEMVWRERTSKIMELVDSTKVRNWPLLLGKWAALSGILITLCLIAIIVGMVVQIAAGGPPVNIGLYFKYAFLNVLPNYLALAFLALFVQTFAPNRIVGMLFAAGAMAFTLTVVNNLPFYHPLMGYSGTSPGSVSEISPYNNWIYFRWFNIYFGALAALFAVIGTWLWRRGLQTSLLQRLKSLKANITPVSSGVAALLLATFIGTGTYIYQAYDKVDWSNRKARELQQVKTEKLLKDEAKLKTPRAKAVSIKADIYPYKQEAVVSGEFSMTNPSKEPIKEVYIAPASSHDEDIRLLELSGATRITEGENMAGDKVSEIEDTGHWLYRFDPPLAPGATATLKFETYFHPPRLADRSVISKNGTFLNNYGTFGASFRAVPMVGAQYQPMTNPDKRRKYELGEREKFPDRTDMEARQNMFFGPFADYIDFEADVCTHEKQFPIAPGDWISETVEDGRRCRSYKSDAKFVNFYSILSAELAVTEDSWTSPTGKVIPIRVYHGENHTYSIPDIIDGIKFGLSHYTEHFGPYQFNYVRVMEVPFISFAQAFAGTIPYAEQGFIMDNGDPEDDKTLDNASQTTMHEIAHQWFAHQIVPAATRGYNVQSEGLTSYAALDAYEAKYGFDKALYSLEKSTIEGMIALMFIDRNKEEPLALASDQQYLVYNKADWVLWSLKHYIGKDKLRGIMRQYIDQYGQKGAPYPTTLELVEALKAGAGPEFHQLIDDQWNRITYWDLKYGDGDIKVSANSDGTYRVDIPFKLDKKIQTEDMDKSESVTEIDGEALNEWIEIGFYQNEPKDKWSAWSDLERLRVNEAESTLSITVSEAPNYIALDPRRLLQERNATDNVKEVKRKLAAN